MASHNPQSDMGLASELFTDMVMQQAVQDKMAEATGAGAAGMVGEHPIAAYTIDGGEKKDDENAESDEDFMDDEADAMMREMANARLMAAKAQYAETQTNRTMGHGTYTEITEQEFLPIVTKTKYVIVAFFHKDFQRCKIMDMHLERICKTHEETRFVKIDAEKCPFFVQKLQVQMLPTVIFFDNGVAFDRLIGFEELGGKDDFPTMALTRKLVQSGIILGKNKEERGEGMRVLKKLRKDDSSDDDY